MIGYLLNFYIIYSGAATVSCLLGDKQLESLSWGAYVPVYTSV